MPSSLHIYFSLLYSPISLFLALLICSVLHQCNPTAPSAHISIFGTYGYRLDSGYIVISKTNYVSAGNRCHAKWFRTKEVIPNQILYITCTGCDATFSFRRKQEQKGQTKKLKKELMTEAAFWVVCPSCVRKGLHLNPTHLSSPSAVHLNYLLMYSLLILWWTSVGTDQFHDPHEQGL